MQALRHLYGKLRLQVNEGKSAVARVWDRQFLGYSFWVAAGKVVKRRVSKKALTKFKERVRQITSRSGGRSLQQVAEELRRYVLGWKAYFGLADTPGGFRDLDQWIHRRLRTLQLRQWKRGRTAYRELRARGVSENLAWRAARFARSWWHVAAHHALHTALPGGVLRRAGCAPAHAVLTSTHRTARCGPACLVVWEGKDRDRRSSPIPIVRYAPCLE